MISSRQSTSTRSSEIRIRRCTSRPSVKHKAPPFSALSSPLSRPNPPAHHIRSTRPDPTLLASQLSGLTPEERESLCALTLAESPQLVVCDNNIDRHSGIEVARELRARGYDGVLLLHTACSAEDKEALETEYIDRFDAVLSKETGNVEEALSLYARASQPIPEALCTALEADAATLVTLTDAGDEETALTVAHKIVGRCAYFPAATRLKAMATQVKHRPTPLHARALMRMVRQARFFGGLFGFEHGVK